MCCVCAFLSFPQVTGYYDKNLVNFAMLSINRKIAREIFHIMFRRVGFIRFFRIQACGIHSVCVWSLCVKSFGLKCYANHDLFIDFELF